MEHPKLESRHLQIVTGEKHRHMQREDEKATSKLGRAGRESGEKAGTFRLHLLDTIFRKINLNSVTLTSPLLTASAEP